MYFFPLTSGNCSCHHGLVLSINCLSELRSATFSQLTSDEAGLLRLAIARARRAGVAKEEVTKAAPALSYIPNEMSSRISSSDSRSRGYRHAFWSILRTGTSLQSQGLASSIRTCLLGSLWTFVRRPRLSCKKSERPAQTGSQILNLQRALEWRHPWPKCFSTSIHNRV